MGLAAASAPSAARARRPEVGPLAEVGLREYHGARFAQSFGDGRVPRRNRAGQRQRSRSCRHPVGGVDVVLDHHRHAVQRPARATCGPLRVESVGDRERLRVGLEHRVEHRSRAVDLLDALQIHLGEGTSRELSGLHALLQLADRNLLEIDYRGRSPQSNSIRVHPLLRHCLGCQRHGAAHEAVLHEVSSSHVGFSCCHSDSAWECRARFAGDAPISSRQGLEWNASVHWYKGKEKRKWLQRRSPSTSTTSSARRACSWVSDC